MAEGRMPNLEVRGRSTFMDCCGLELHRNLSRRPSEGLALREPGGRLSSIVAETAHSCSATSKRNIINRKTALFAVHEPGVVENRVWEITRTCL